jgi:hypothetical protein
MISNELAGIIRQQDANFYADSVGDDVYTWDVWMGNFKQSSPLSKVGCSWMPGAHSTCPG